MDEQENELVARALGDSFSMKVSVRVLLYGEFEQREVNGVVERLDQLRRRFMVDGEWVSFADVEGASAGESASVR
ncbi:hypothetical protein [Paenibacillus sp. PAMC21692]|uniref:hypothetical protein n=1 Tax=Paenibacillus sp. PAMC21692 TaxID=2762320 RepID=UPI00164E169D|nr:hypothetical protein [Paenibacillus sp. PAMC21692]QNK56783.1 hypothetical protein H7F31_30400 [Paenibacillus sp. PAMC21692]